MAGNAAAAVRGCTSHLPRLRFLGVGVPGRMTTATDTWIERVRAADADAERTWKALIDAVKESKSETPIFIPLLAIAAEFRAQRIARRPGAGQ